METFASPLPGSAALEALRRACRADENTQTDRLLVAAGQEPADGDYGKVIAGGWPGIVAFFNKHSR